MSEGKNRKLIKQFWQIAGPNRRTFLFALSLTFVVMATDLFKPLLQLRGIEAMSEGNKPELIQSAWLFLAVVFLDYIARSGYNYIFSVALLRTIHRMRQALFRHVLSMKMAFFDTKPVGELLTRTINDCEALGETLRAGAGTILIDALSVAVTFFVLAKINLELSLYLLLAGPPLVLTVRWCGAQLRARFFKVRVILSRSNAFMAEGIIGVEILQLFGQRRASTNSYREINKLYRHNTIVNNGYDALLYALIDGIAALTTALILFAAFSLRFSIVELATAMVFLSQVERIFNPIRMLSGKITVLQQALAALDRIFSLLNHDATIPQGELKLSGKNLNVSFKNVSFRYSEGGPQVLSGIDFTVKQGQTLAFVGQTGSGKSTIVKLLTRTYDGYSGRIEVGGKELRMLNYHSLRAHIAMVHQDVELFPGTLRDNIRMFDTAIGEQSILAAIQLVKADHMVSQLTDGLDFVVNDGGSNLSAGQKQLIVFARALAHDVPIVLMDEATSSVDSLTEAWIQQAIVEIMKHKTVIVVAHRLSTIAAADKILVLKDGEIFEQGNHDTLMGLEAGYYAGLVQASKLQSRQQTSNLLI